MTAPRTTGPMISAARALAELRAEAARALRDALSTCETSRARLALGVLELARSAQREGVVAVLRAAKAGAR